MDEVTVINPRPDGTVEIVMGIPRADVPSEITTRGVAIDVGTPDGLVIYGRAVSSPDDPHDQEHIDRMRERGQVFSECFSVIETRGELGTHPLAAVTEISREEFEAARARGWRS